MSASSGQSRRPRAPTITIDISAVGRSSENLVQPNLEYSQTSYGRPSPMLRPTSTGQSTSVELRKSGSFESRESQPTSPHNISSPTQISHPQNFLAVPVQRPKSPHNVTSPTPSRESAFFLGRKKPVDQYDPNKRTHREIRLQSERTWKRLQAGLSRPIHPPLIFKSADQVLADYEQRTSRSSSHHSPLFAEPNAPGLLNGCAVSPLADKGATANFVSYHRAQRANAQIDKTAKASFMKPDGARLDTLGTVKLPFCFQGESDVHSLTFHVLKNSLVDVILGNHFLRQTETFTRHAQRIYHILRTGRSSRACLTGYSQQRLGGYLDGCYSHVVDDTGSNVNLESPGFAESSGHKVDTSPQHCIELAFVDGTTARASGVVHGAKWTWDGASEDPHPVDIYVLPGLDVDVLFGYPSLCEIEAYSKHQDSLLDIDDGSHDGEGGFLRNIIRTGETIFDACKRKLLGRPKPALTPKQQNDQRKILNHFAQERSAANGLPEPERTLELAKIQSRYDNSNASSIANSPTLPNFPVVAPASAINSTAQASGAAHPT